MPGKGEARTNTMDRPITTLHRRMSSHLCTALVNMVLPVHEGALAMLANCSCRRSQAEAAQRRLQPEAANSRGLGSLGDSGIQQDGPQKRPRTLGCNVADRLHEAQLARQRQACRQPKIPTTWRGHDL